MLSQLFLQESRSTATPKEGDVYKVLQIHQRQIELRYGYYEAQERENPDIDPMPIYPDFLKDPWFTDEGFPFVTKMQDVCEHYQGKAADYCECAECSFYSHGDDLIGICVCPHRQQTGPGKK
ncbi:MAG: hypothetical protein IKY59_01215 [Oscillospiraceae bacterium]|nr:hypothetical protein [Oscillospiraceae bacterium]